MTTTTTRVGLAIVLGLALAAAAAAAADAAMPAPDRVVRLARPATAALPADLTSPEGRTRWRFSGLATAEGPTRSVTVDGSSVVVEDRDGETTARTVWTDPAGGSAAERWALPDRRRDLLHPGASDVLDLERTRDGRTEHVRILVDVVGIGWIELPSGPREVALQRALVLVGPEGSETAERLAHRWIDPRAGVVAEVSGPPAPDGRSRLAVGGVTLLDAVVSGAADLIIHLDELDTGIKQAVTYGWDRGAGTPVSSLTPDGYATVGDLIAASAWDFSGNTSGDEVAQTTVPVVSSETCNIGQCGYDAANGRLNREDHKLGLPDAYVNNQVTERVVGATDATVWLRAGAQKEGVSGAFGTGESRLCYIGNDGTQERTQVPLWRFPHQDATGFYLQPGDTWQAGPFQCEQNIFNTVCGSGGLFPRLWSKACGTHAGTQSGEVIKGGVVTLPSGHTVNALLVRTLADFCVYTVSGCPALFKADEVRTVVYLWQTPYLGTVVLLQSDQNVADTTSFTTVHNTDITYGLFPPLSITVTATTDTTVDLSWNPGNDTHKISSYKIYWDTDSGSVSPYAFDSDADASQVTFNGTSATISGLAPGTTYYFTVTSRSEFQHLSDPPGTPTVYESIVFPTQVSGDPSSVYPTEVQALTTGGGCTPTEEVTGLVESKVAGGIEICWNAVTDACAVGYRVLGSDTADSDAGFAPIADVDAATTCWTGAPASRYFLVVSRGGTGTGPWGHYGR